MHQVNRALKHARQFLAVCLEDSGACGDTIDEEPHLAGIGRIESLTGDRAAAVWLAAYRKEARNNHLDQCVHGFSNILVRFGGHFRAGRRVAIVSGEQESQALDMLEGQAQVPEQRTAAFEKRLFVNTQWFGHLSILTSLVSKRLSAPTGKSRVWARRCGFQWL